MIRFLNPADHPPARTAKGDADFTRRPDFKDITFPVKSRDIHKIEIKNYTGISVFGYENNVKYAINISKKYCEDNHVDLLLISEREKKHYVLIIMDNHTLHRGRKHFYRYC